MPFAAFDIHLKSVEAVLTDDAGAIQLRRNFPATIEVARRGKDSQRNGVIWCCP